MKAAVMRVNNEPLSLEELHIDDPAPGEVLVKTAASGICHSDLHMVEGGIPLPPPAVLGHEPAGVVEAVGEGVTEVAPGDHVIGCLNRWCGVCKFCTGGRPYLCMSSYVPTRGLEGKPRITDGDGKPVGQLGDLSSFAEKMLCPERSLVKIRDDMPLDRACLIGCGVTTGLGAALKTVNVPGGSERGHHRLRWRRAVGAAGRAHHRCRQDHRGRLPRAWKFELARRASGRLTAWTRRDGDPGGGGAGADGWGRRLRVRVHRTRPDRPAGDRHDRPRRNDRAGRAWCR